MTGEYFEIKGDSFRVVALDGHRISIRKSELKDSYDDVSVIVPGKALKELIKILNNDIESEVQIFINRNKRKQRINIKL